MVLKLPHKFEPRPYQIPFLRAMDSGKKRAVKVWHRKAGKEKTDFNFAVKESQKRVGNYWYIFPKLTQARKVIWEGIDQDGVRFLDHIPKQILDGEPNSTLMLLRFRNGSTLQMIGSDTFDTSIGGNPVGVVFSEYSLTNPYVWTYLRPILANNGGWAVFNFTPRGENHAYDLYNLAKNDPENWFCELLTVDDTKALSKEILEQEKREIIQLHGNDALYQQEYFCNFSVPLAGAYYAEQIILAYREGRIGNVQYEDRVVVDTWWDLGNGDAMAIWFTQSVGAEVRIIDFHQGISDGLPEAAKMLKDKGYLYGRHHAPHDIMVKEMNGRTRIETAKGLGISFKILPKLPIMDGIDAARSLFRKCWFDQKKCALGINALKNYRKEYNEEKKCFLDNPYHDWASHAADAFRYCAIGLSYTKSSTNDAFVRNEVAAREGGWKGGNYVPEWAQTEERYAWR